MFAKTAPAVLLLMPTLVELFEGKKILVDDASRLVPGDVVANLTHPRTMPDRNDHRVGQKCYQTESKKSLCRPECLMSKMAWSRIQVGSGRLQVGPKIRGVVARGLGQ